jgi:ribonuclease HII
MSLKICETTDKIEAGIDEVARGCLFGRVYAAAVIWGKEEISLPPKMKITDSKKMSAKQRERAAEFIKEHALAYSVSYRDNNHIDEHNILQSAISAMHAAIGGLSIEPDLLLVDGTYFHPYYSSTKLEWLSHTCIPKGDAQYFSIACASILAKVEHDRYIHEVCESHPEFDERYGLLSNMGYGTAKHLQGILNFGITEYHRKSFSPCK